MKVFNKYLSYFGFVQILKEVESDLAFEQYLQWPKY